MAPSGRRDQYVYRIRGGVITRTDAGRSYATYRRALAVDGQPVEDADGFRWRKVGAPTTIREPASLPTTRSIFEAFRQVDGSPAVSMAAQV